MSQVSKYLESKGWTCAKRTRKGCFTVAIWRSPKGMTFPQHEAYRRAKLHEEFRKAGKP